MESLNSTSSRAAAPAENMRTLEKAIVMADQRLRMRRQGNVNAALILATAFSIPFCSYMIFNFFAPTGVMQNYKASSGAYMSYTMKWMLKPQSMTMTYRPEIEMANQQGALHVYTKKIEGQRTAGELPEGLHHPTSWH